MRIAEARPLAEHKLLELAQVLGSPPLVLLADVNVADHGWCYLFFYTTARHLESGDVRDLLPPGPGPIAVNKDGSDVWVLKSSRYVQQLEQYAQQHGIDTGPDS